jgi:hypothetical protein
MVDLYECFMELDCEGTGIEELYRIRMAGRTILEKEKIKRKPFAFFVPLPTPHTPFGENYAKFVIPTQNARTVLFRGIVDHTVITNNPRMLVMNGTLANPSELMDNRLGGLVNVRRIDGIMPMPQSPLNPFVFEAIKLLDEDKEEATGISKLSQGLNKDAISKQNSQGMVEGLISNSQTRQKIIARQFGEFLKNLWLLIYDTALEQLDQQQFIDVNGTWTPVDPRRWIERQAVTVDLCLSEGDALKEAAKCLQMHAFLSTDPSFAQQYGPEQKYNLLKRILRKSGFPDVESILLPPEKAPPAEPNPMEQAQLQALQAEAMLKQAQAQKAMADPQIDAQKVQGELAIKSEQLRLDALEQAHEAAMDIKEMELAQKAPDSNKNAVFAPDGG